MEEKIANVPDLYFGTQKTRKMGNVKTGRKFAGAGSQESEKLRTLLGYLVLKFEPNRTIRTRSKGDFSKRNLQKRRKSVLLGLSPPAQFGRYFGTKHTNVILRSYYPFLCNGFLISVLKVEKSGSKVVQVAFYRKIGKPICTSQSSKTLKP